jgi:hypothetical protein
MARDEYEAAWRSHRDVEPDMVDIFEPRLREWLVCRDRGHEKEVAALLAEVARLRILVQRVSDMKEVSDSIQLQELLIDWNEEAEVALREIAGAPSVIMCKPAEEATAREILGEKP